MKNILVTGGTGYIGSSVLNALNDSQNINNLRIIDSINGFSPQNLPKNCEFINADIRDSNVLKTALEGVDTIFHFAAIVGDVACEKDPKLTREVNVDAVKNLIALSLKTDVQRIMFSSTCTVYGLQPDGNPVTEGTSPNPTSLYGSTKLEAEKLFEKAHEEFGLDYCTFRLSTVYGPSDSYSMKFNIFPNLFVLNACKLQNIMVFGGDKWRPLIFLTDLVQAFLKAAKASKHKVAGETFNLGGNSENYTIREVADTVAKEVPGTKVEEKMLPPDRRSYKVNFDKIESILDFTPSTTLHEGVRELRDLINKGIYNELPPVAKLLATI